MNNGAAVRYAGRAAAVAVLGLCLCRNPYLPPRGMPPPGACGTLRCTPTGVIRQLIKSYETRNLNLFIDLLSEDFRFYIAPNFVEEFLAGHQGEGYEEKAEYIDGSRFSFVQEGLYYYWNYTDEYNRHQRLFRNAARIDFTSRPVYARDMVFSVAGAETTAVEVVMEGGEIEIETALYGVITVQIERQVFFCTRDPDDPELWAVVKWFDLSSL